MFPVVALLAICCSHSLGVLGNRASGICLIKDNRLDCKEQELDRVPSLTNDAEDKYSDVDLSKNKLTQLKRKSFEKFTNLRTLNLAKNLIVDIKDGAFTGLSKLRLLYLSGNQLTTFTLKHLAPLVSLQTLAIHNNQFHCDCSFVSLMTFVKKTQKKGSKYKVPNVNQITCDGSDLVKGKALVSLSEELLCDVDECKINTHGCSKFASCFNTGGSYNCRCKKGFTGNGRKCRDVNECAMVCPHKCDPKRAFCANTDGSYKCFCRNGFEKILGHCHDVDECKAGLHRCGPHAVCSNNVGSYSCTCQDGYYGDGYTCVKTMVAEQSGIDLRCIAFGVIVMIVCIPMLLSADYWLKKQRANRENKYKWKKSTKKRKKVPSGKFFSLAEKRILAYHLLHDLEKGDPREEVVYTRESKTSAGNSKENPDMPESHEKIRDIYTKQLQHDFSGSYRQELYDELHEAIFKRKESPQVLSSASSSTPSTSNSSLERPLNGQ